MWHTIIPSWRGDIIIHIGSKFGPWGFWKSMYERTEGFKWSCSHFWHLNNVFDLLLFGFRVKNVFDTWVTIYVECAADNKICIYCWIIIFLFFLYFCHYSLYKSGIKGKLGNFPTWYNFKSLKLFIR